jgi:hypothetical protein
MTLTEKLKALTIAKATQNVKSQYKSALSALGPRYAPGIKTRTYTGFATVHWRSRSEVGRERPTNKLVVIQRSDNRWNIGNIWPFLLEDHGTWDSA